MGVGDELMMAGEARKRAAGTQAKFRLLDKNGNPKWHDIWNGNPNIARVGEPAQGDIGYVNRRRSYIVDETAQRRTFREYQPTPAFVLIDDIGARFGGAAAGHVLFAVSVKSKAPINKDWGYRRWEKLVASGHEEFKFMQLWQPESPPHVRFAVAGPTAPRYPWIAGVVRGARAIVCQEGFLHHLAAAVGTPAVVIRGGYISPKVTGYEGQADLYVDDPDYPLGCGMRVPCKHCEHAMEKITPELVLDTLRDLLKRTGR